MFHIQIAFYICVSMIPSVLQPNVSITASVGGLVILECHTTADLVVAWFWLKQIPGQKLNPIVSTYYQEIKLQEEFLNESRIQFKVDDKKSALIFTKINSRDARDHCGVLLYEKLYFGGGTYLAVNGEWKLGINVLQSQIHDISSTGGNVTLLCTIQNEQDSCGGDHKVYWFKHGLGKSHSGIIYTQGSCKNSSMAVSPTKSCLYSLSLRNIKPSDAGTYYCAVVTCTDILFGHGINLTSDVVYILSSHFTVDDAVFLYHRTSDLNYAALKFTSQSSRQQREERQRPTEYSGLKCKNSLS
uniref:Ig-like domain-containing protein n=1 Tax=Sinocyclocheilus grahami TaxID=75366 RepID=A0A672QXN1_SINGR